MENSSIEDSAPPSITTLNGKQDQVDLPKHTIISSRGFGSEGRHISLLTNYFKVDVNYPDAMFYQYNVSITAEDDGSVDSKGISRKVIHKLYQSYSSELSGKLFAYDGGKSIYTVGPLPKDHFEFLVVLEKIIAKHETKSPVSCGSCSQAGKRSKHSFESKTFKVEINYASKVPLKSLSPTIKGTESDTDTQDALRVLNIILRQQAAKRGNLVVRQSFFCEDPKNFIDVGGGVTGCRGLHSSFHTTHSGLTLNMDVSTVMVLKPGPVINFLLSNQNVSEPRNIDWEKAKKMLKNLRIKTRHTNREFKIYGLSEKQCFRQTFPIKKRSLDGSSDEQPVETTVYEYFSKHHDVELSSSAYMPCLDVGKPNRPNYLPLELCDLIALQLYKKPLSTKQRLALAEKSRQKPLEQMQIVTDAVRNYHSDEDPLLATFGLVISKQLTQFDGRVLEAPKLKVGKKEDCIPHNGRWNYKNKQLLSPTRIERWAVVNFSAQCDSSYLSRELISCARHKGIHMERPLTLFEEDTQFRKASAVSRVENMFDKILAKFSNAPEFLLCVLPERKYSDLYGPWKKKTLSDLGILTQCISPLKITDQYLSNVLIKINSKLGGINSLLEMEYPSCIPLLKDTPSMILGMFVSRGSPAQLDIPSIAAVVGSRSWPLISRYRASVRAQSTKKMMIDSLHKPLADGYDDGIIRELLLEFYSTSNARKPAQIIVFRDGVMESQFQQVLDVELKQIMKAFLDLGEVVLPKFTVIVVQRNHQTKLFQAGAPQNVPPGTVVDTHIVHPKNYDFYMCAHAGIVGTSRPAHYNVLVDEIGFSPDELQNFIHSLSYVYQRSTSATSTVAPVRYAHHAAQQMRQFMQSDHSSETSSELNDDLIPELPRLHEKVRSSMFFC